MNRDPTFSLWSEPWMEAERLDGTVALVSLETLLHEAQQFRRLYDPSPLVVVAVQRLLVAILQDALRPTQTAELVALWRAARLPAEAIERFGATFAHRFDLFSETLPFLQSADLPLAPAKRSDAKPVGYLFPEQPAGTAVTHYTHAYDGEAALCAPCAAKGLLLLPPFASSGGAGIRPSINGVPPIYVLPNLETLALQLIASLVRPVYQPDVADQTSDTPWWRREPALIGKKEEVLKVGYGHSLTFPARRVRLHPEAMTTPCLRCGTRTPWGARTMIFEMGESRPKDFPLWRDPFAAYRVAEDKPQPIPVRPVEGRALWREFANLFLPTSKDKGKQHHLRPRLLDQLEDLWHALPEMPTVPLRTVGLRTDMKMKIFEWEEADFTLPASLLGNDTAEGVVRNAIEFATKADGTLKKTFQVHFAGTTKDARRQESVRARLSQQYWAGLESHFRDFILRLGSGAEPDELEREWAQHVVRHGQKTFHKSMKRLARDGATLRQQMEGERHCYNALHKLLSKTYPEEPAP